MLMVAISNSAIRPAPSLITRVEVGQWGRELAFDGFDDPFARRRTTLRSSVCRDLHWSNYGDAATETEADVIGLCLGQANYLEAAIITTDLFELTIHYGTLTVGATSVDRGAIDAQLAAV